jgi:dihydropteroate synthase
VPRDPHLELRCGDRSFIRGERTLVMGIVNVTPDSFSDGNSDFLNPSLALDRGLMLLDEGADILDIGAVSTAPGRAPVSMEEELRRLRPVLEAFAKRNITNISLDTSTAEVAKLGLSLGVSWINDQAAGMADEAMGSMMAKADAVILMHGFGKAPSGVDAGEQISYKNVIQQVRDFFIRRLDKLSKEGVEVKKVIVDPGIGFGKGMKDTLSLINGMHHFNDIGALSLVGLSRKSFLGKLTGRSEPRDRDAASLAAAAMAVMSGAKIIRTHNVQASVDLARVLDASLAYRKQPTE